MGRAPGGSVISNREFRFRLFEQMARCVQSSRRMYTATGLFGRLNRLAGVTHLLCGDSGAGRKSDGEQHGKEA